MIAVLQINNICLFYQKSNVVAMAVFYIKRKSTYFDANGKELLATSYKYPPPLFFRKFAFFITIFSIIGGGFLFREFYKRYGLLGRGL